MPGPLEPYKVIELSSDRGAFAGKLMAELGADVIVVEPPGGDPSRANGPFADDMRDPESSLWWWHYNTSKRGVTLDLDQAEDRERLRTLVAGADIFLESEAPGRLADLDLDYESLRTDHPELIHVAITPYGRSGPRHDEPATDLTLLAGGGPVWSCGYDDHSMPPVRGGGNQAFHTACHFAVMSTLVAILSRGQTDRGQFIDVNMHAAANVTTEVSTYGWLTSGKEVMRQTGRHASYRPTGETQARCADGAWVNTGVPPMKGDEFRALIEWIDELGLREEFADSAVLALGANYDRITVAMINDDELCAEIFGAGRSAMLFLASKMRAYDFFVGTQERGLPTGIVNAPEDVMDDPHFIERGFPVDVPYDSVQRVYRHPGAPIRFTRTPWELRHRAPRIGEHNASILGSAGALGGEVDVRDGASPDDAGATKPSWGFMPERPARLRRRQSPDR